MMSVLFTVILRVFMIWKRAKKIIEVGCKSSILSSDSLKNIDFSESYKQSKIA